MVLDLDRDWADRTEHTGSGVRLSTDGKLSHNTLITKFRKNVALYYQGDLLNDVRGRPDSVNANGYSTSEQEALDSR